MACFQFGARRKRKTSHGQDSEVGDYALHVQCPWRIVRGDEIVVGSADLYAPDPVKDAADSYFDWQKGNLQDAKIAKLFADDNRQFAVVATALRAAGKLDILFDDELRLEVFPDSSVGAVDTEHWRFFAPSVGSDLHTVKSHIVFSGAGLCYE
ncbi:MAG: hypothetical protein ACXVZV_02160 [Terriglobales bacterium]